MCLFLCWRPPVPVRKFLSFLSRSVFSAQFVGRSLDAVTAVSAHMHMYNSLHMSLSISFFLLSALPTSKLAVSFCLVLSVRIFRSFLCRGCRCALHMYKSSVSLTHQAMLSFTFSLPHGSLAFLAAGAIKKSCHTQTQTGLSCPEPTLVTTYTHIPTHTLVYTKTHTDTYYISIPPLFPNSSHCGCSVFSSTSVCFIPPLPAPHPPP